MSDDHRPNIRPSAKLLTKISLVRSVHIKIGLAVCLLLLILSGTALDGVVAQTEDEEWTAPVNLSNSGSSSSPFVVVDSRGTVHVLWHDAFSGYVYTQGDGFNWATPRPVTLPFSANLILTDAQTGTLASPSSPILHAGQDGAIHAIWTESDGNVFYSRAGENQLSNLAAWLLPQQLAEMAADKDITVDSSGRVHVAYLRSGTSDLSPAGIYYQRSPDGGNTWFPPRRLFESPYLRSVSAADAHVQIESTENNEIFVSWDNRPIGRVYTIRSTDGGVTWSPLAEVDSRQAEDQPESIAPRDIAVIQSGDTIHRIWRAGHGSDVCTLFGQLSQDGGDTWSSGERLFDTLEECPRGTHLLVSPDNRLLMWIIGEEGSYFSSFDQSEWSEPELQQPLHSFTDSQTFMPVELGCHQPAAIGSGSGDSEPVLLMVGCDAGDGDDIWLLSRTLSSPGQEAGVEERPLWNPLAMVTSTDLGTITPKLVADSDGFLHAFWNQPESDSTNQGATFYSRWDGNRWSQPALVLTPPTGVSTDTPDVTVDPLGRLLVTWSSSRSGNAFFSQVEAGQAALASEWLMPVQLPSRRTSASSPQIAVDRGNIIYIVYALPLNEDRGIYLTTSTDGGVQWSDPLQVFDAVEAGWDMVDRPRVAAGADGSLHVVWTRMAMPPDGDSFGMHYSRSTDGGATWSSATEITAAPVSWSRIVALGGRIVHIIWQDGGGTVWHQMSQDRGITWSRPVRVITLSESGLTDIAVDGAGRLLLVNVESTVKSDDSDGQQPLFHLRQWIYEDDRWVTGEGLDLDALGNIGSVSAAVGSGGDLDVLISGQMVESEDEIPRSGLFFTNHRLDLPEVLPTPLPSLTPTATPLSLPVSTRAPTPTPTVFFPRDSDQNGTLLLPIDADDPFTGSLLGIIPAGIVVVVVFFIGVRILRRDRR